MGKYSFFLNPGKPDYRKLSEELFKLSSVHNCVSCPLISECNLFSRANHKDLCFSLSQSFTFYFARYGNR